MIKLLRYSVLFIFYICISKNTYAQFPYVESFRNATAPGITFGGSPSAFLTAAGNAYDITAGAHTGSPIDNSGNGYLRLTTNLQNEKGYAISNAKFPSSNGLSVMFEYYIYGGNGADGISFFLFDATAEPFNIGGFGGSLGYAQYTNTTPTSAGVSKGYLAVGLDEYGNFSNPIEGRQGGIAGLTPGSVTLRGKGDGNLTIPSNYPYLASAKMSNFGFELVGNGGLRQPDPTNEGYRKVFMDMAPNPDGGYNISVKITKGGPTQTTVSVINYYYPEEAPVNLRYGFASSTGYLTNYHEIRNVTINAYNGDGLVNPTAANDLLTVCQGKQSIVDVTTNDTTVNPGGTLNKSSIDLDPNATGIQNSFKIANKGTFTRNAQGLIEFTPEPLFIGSVSCNYTIRDSFGRTSNTAVISLTYVEPPAQPNAGQDQLVNISTAVGSATLQGSALGTGTSGKWTKVSGPLTATITSPLSSNTTITNLFSGIYVFRWSVTSAGGCELSDDIQVIINHRPIAVNDTIVTNLNTSIAIPVLVNDNDEDGQNTLDRASILLKVQPANGTLKINNLTGVVTYLPNPGYSGPDAFVYTIKDNYGVESNLATVYITINGRPIGVEDISNTTINTPVEIVVQNNDPGKTGLTVINGTSPVNGTIIINADGTIIYTPSNGFSGIDIFTYLLRNKDGITSEPVRVTVNVKPTGVSDFANTPTNLPVVIPVKGNDLSKVGTTTSFNENPLNGTILINPNGTITYTPKPGFSGKDSFTYVLKTTDGLTSDPITVNVDVIPVGSPDNLTTPLNKPITIMAKDNDLSRVGTTIILGAKPLNGTISLDASNNILYTPNRGYSGTETFTYTLRTADGLSSSPITVTVNVTPIVLPVPPDFNITVPINQPLTIDVPIPAGSTVVITDAPKHGTITLDPVTGKPIYTPTPGYNGPDDFSYIIRDADGNESVPGKVTLTVIVPAKIGLAKSLKSGPTKNLDGTFDLTYLFTLVNYGEVAINRVSLTDDLLAVFSGNTIKVNQVTATGSLVANSSYNGASVKELLSSASTLAKLSKEYVEVSITVALDKQEGTFNNTAYTEGYSAGDGNKVSDASTDGLNPDPGTPADVSPSAVTPVKIVRQELFIPGGFSPNNDGINDYFVIENTQGKKIDLEVYNRWGNLIHRSKTYQNDWAGKTTEGIHLGDDVPTGTYYYIIKIDGKDKRVGYITINR